ncbi:ATP cone domain-containing protein [Aestuariibaculum sediminum]|uniref:ATPase n=1 Tax=Aestuariibaculum sediminum TaxID=2770637 RepID=A0A8J6Q3C8_9FLAO|nr:ATP cone domain-containing protein [Aestuariibaculum sediminum]MBD0833426.1 ATPase [Aestuariibaculum sediminum]
MKADVDVIKYSGEKVKFSLDKLKKSLIRSGAAQNTVEEIVSKVVDELYDNISTKEIYNRAYALLKKEKSYLASKYKLKKAIYELGPTGFPFERFISAVLKYSGYQTEVDRILQGTCISHEVDVVAIKENKVTIVECKFHSEKTLKCNVKVPLYINSRYNDIRSNWKFSQYQDKFLTEGWVVTNTRFSEDALTFGNCVNLYLLSWDYPKNDGLKDCIDRLRLYPITVSTLLSNREKQFLLSRDVVLCRELIDDAFYLDHLGVSENRKKKILHEVGMLCKS